MGEELIYNKDFRDILRKSRMNFLLGAGASYLKNKNGVSYPLMEDLVVAVINDDEHKSILKLFTEDNLVNSCYSKYIIENRNFEEYLSSIEGLLNYPYNKESKDNLKKLIDTTKRVVMKRLKSSNNSEILEEFKKFYIQILNLNNDKEEVYKRINVFTTNYDMLNEIALEEIGVHYYSGFFGLKNRRFNPAFYNFTYSDDMNLKTKSYIIKNEHINLYKLHGSLSWKLVNNDLIETQDFESNNNPVIIYPSHSKYNQSNLIAYYSTLMREFLNQISNEQSSLIVIGYSFGDEHINKLIQSALSIENFVLIAFLFSENDYKHFKEKIGIRSNTKLIKGDRATLTHFNNFLEGSINEEN